MSEPLKILLCLVQKFADVYYFTRLTLEFVQVAVVSIGTHYVITGGQAHILPRLVLIKKFGVSRNVITQILNVSELE